jgi:hypothetical protein
MVADAIGQRRSLLIICQKQAALDVVHKRLESEGLGGRIMMVSDVNKDRRRTIQTIRDQLEQLRTRPGGQRVWEQRRQQTAARIEALEGELNSYHEALHQPDDGSGLSYRLMIGDLVGFNAGTTEPIDVPMLRRVLGALHISEVATLQETCGPLARHWLPTRFENSPLAALKPFGADTGALSILDQAFHDFKTVETARIDAVQRTPNALSIADPEACRQWISSHEASFLTLSDEQRTHLARWLPLLWPGEREPAKAKAFSLLEETGAGLESLALTHTPDKTGEGLTKAITVAVGLDGPSLTEWIALVDELAAPASFWANLSPSRWSKRRVLQRFLNENGFQATADFIEAFREEQTLRPWREPIVKLFQGLREPFEIPPHSRASELAQQVRQLAERLHAIDQVVQRLASHPFPESARAMAAKATREAVEELRGRCEQGIIRHGAQLQSEVALDALEPWFQKDWLDARLNEINKHDASQAALAETEQVWPTLAAYQRFRVRAGQLDEKAMAVFACLRGVQRKLEETSAEDLDAQVRRIIGRESRLAWKSRLETSCPSLLLGREEIQAKIQALAADKEMRLIEGIDGKRISSARDWESITRLTGQRALRLREFVDRGADLGLMELRPIWLMNPDVASRVLPLKRALFHNVIFDEASQMPIEYALPSLFRSGHMVVSGDEKQMPPTAFFSSRVENDEAESFEVPDEDAGEEEREAMVETWDRREIKDCPDLLQLAKTVLPTTTLQIHYRSTFRELIQFSNASFYANRLSVPARHPETEIRRVQPIEIVPAQGTYMDQTNPKEAEVVCDVLMRFWAVPPEHRKSVGVVTFNRKQADLIEEVLEKRAEHDLVFRVALTEERDRTDNGEDMGFFVKNVENVQGDERDVIVFSSTFGRNAQGTFRRSFGVLGQTGGERRLNVAVTRAREKIVLVTLTCTPK